MSLTVGHITYANCAPFFHFLSDSGFAGEIIDGVPAELNRMLATGKLDICPSSSIEYARHASDYLLLPGHSISSIGPVQSVLLFTDRPMNRLSDIPVTITGESATSVALLRVLLQEFFEISDLEFRKESLPKDVFENIPMPFLLIGDRALKARSNISDSCMVIDLGELWYHYTGLPFVFALWIVNRRTAENKQQEVRQFLAQLDRSRSQARNSFDKMAMVAPEREWMGEKGLVEYWRQVSYELDPRHIEGLRCFYYLLEKHGLIDHVPDIVFFE